MQFSFSPKNRQVKGLYTRERMGKWGHDLSDRVIGHSCLILGLTDGLMATILLTAKTSRSQHQNFERRYKKEKRWWARVSKGGKLLTRSSTTKLNTTHFLPISHSQNGQKNDDDVSY